MTTTRAHETVFSVTYDTERRARIVADALGPEVGEIDDARSTAAVDREGDAVRVRVAADDLVALRAGVNSWSRLVAVAERVGALDG
ncbi:KEOPS complex Pcc1-like subunit [Halorubrum sp. GN11_10-6_MGM]|uniref:KEOPS complex subunit Pcc1 n=1 Tax=Halorubrum sp. GN11_10-6_MGM TaxID=2518112 RepID=UPI0010F768F4|nr:KEOPS complex subunit Pcc1 [Halorubrum sp. GN11_10-6_MGM]TKX73522.1 KEOPS complex Pcc1-like subunit [Halorubrum sp. GN11_10-6_MGM]